MLLLETSRGPYQGFDEHFGDNFSYFFFFMITCGDPSLKLSHGDGFNDGSLHM